jgi:hypothetical protein
MICSSKTPNAAGGAMAQGFAALVGGSVTSVECAHSTFDLVLSLSNHRKISLFCDCFDQAQDGSNWSLFTPSGVFVVHAMTQLVLEAALS